MTDKQKQSINILRKEGYGYGTIAKKLGMKKDTVKSYCRRHGVEKIVRTPENMYTICRNCGEHIEQNPKRKKKLYCSDKCRLIWWRMHPELLNRKAIYEYLCLECGKAFQAYGNANRKYCSHDCYIKHRFESGLCDAGTK